MEREGERANVDAENEMPRAFGTDEGESRETIAARAKARRAVCSYT